MRKYILQFTTTLSVSLLMTTFGYFLDNYTIEIDDVTVSSNVIILKYDETDKIFNSRS